jgi:hypothetical protein
MLRRAPSSSAGGRGEEAKRRFGENEGIVSDQYYRQTWADRFDVVNIHRGLVEDDDGLPDVDPHAQSLKDWQNPE